MSRLAPLVCAVLLGACYEPRFEACAVRCANGIPCPDGMSCGRDLNCHADESEPACPPSELSVTIRRVGNGDLGGVVVDETGRIDCGTRCEATVLEGTTLNLAASGDGTARFNAWFGIDGCDDVEKCMTVVNDDLEIEVEFVRQFPVTVYFLGNGTGRVTSEPPGLDCTSDVFACSAPFDLQQVVTLTAFPDNAFLGWSLPQCGSAPTCTFTVAAEVEVDAEFE